MSVRRFSLPCLVIIVAVARASAADVQSFCPGEYAEDLSALSQHARDIEGTSGPYSYAVRTTASYECLSYGRDGDVKRSRTTARASGTAFGYRRDGSDTLLLTNAHVAEWPAVTDEDHAVDDVPAGCKRVADSLEIVDDDHDTYAADDVPLVRVVVDPALDVAVLRAYAKLEIIPWRVAFGYREAVRTASTSRVDSNRTAEKKRSLNRTLAAQRDAAQVILDMVGRERSRAAGPTIGIIDVETGSPSISTAVNMSP